MRHTASHHKSSTSTLWTTLPLVALLGACSTAPKPPTADEATRRPANHALTVDLQACKTDLHNTRLLASESTRLAETTTAAMHQLAMARGSFASLSAQRTDKPTHNTIHTLRFAADSTALAHNDETLKVLAPEAKSAALIVLRGRTDATAEDPANTQTARARAETARDALLLAGVDPQRIRLTWQGFGDTVADNSTAEGRAANRRVEVEIYRREPTRANSLPMPADSPAPTNAKASETSAAVTAAASTTTTQSAP